MGSGGRACAKLVAAMATGVERPGHAGQGRRVGKGGRTEGHLPESGLGLSTTGEPTFEPRGTGFTLTFGESSKCTG